MDFRGESSSLVTILDMNICRPMAGLRARLGTQAISAYYNLIAVA